MYMPGGIVTKEVKGATGKCETGVLVSGRCSARPCIYMIGKMLLLELFVQKKNVCDERIRYPRRVHNDSLCFTSDSHLACSMRSPCRKDVIVRRNRPLLTKKNTNSGVCVDDKKPQDLE